jgi:hypothetical protein
MPCRAVMAAWATSAEAISTNPKPVLSGAAVVTGSVFSQNGTAVPCGTEPTSFYNSYFVGNCVGFGILLDPITPGKGPSGPSGLITVFMRDNKQKSVPTVAFY